MTVIITVYLVHNGTASLELKLSVVSIVLCNTATPLMFVGRGGRIPAKSIVHHLICLLLDTFKFYLTVFIIPSYLYYQFGRSNHDEATKLWSGPIVSTASMLFVIKTFVISSF